MTATQSVGRRHDVNIIGPIDAETNTGFRVEILAQEKWIHLGSYGSRRIALDRATKAVS